MLFSNEICKLSRGQILRPKEREYLSWDEFHGGQLSGGSCSWGNYSRKNRWGIKV